MKDFLGENKSLRFDFPIDGDCLNSLDGQVTENGLKIRVRISAPENTDVTVNRANAVFDGKNHVCDITITESPFVLTARAGGQTEQITVFDSRHTEGKYRISSDDNILFLRDINANRDTYKSIFENPYLAVYKRAHDLYGAAVHLNLFYETDDMHNFSDKGEYFNLSMMTDKFKDEFERNSDWLRLSFHARSEFPDKPYRNTSACRIAEDSKRINDEIIRFAGEKTLADVTTVHWGEANRECTIALRDQGYRTLAGYFEHNKRGEPLVAYYYPDSLIDHVGERDFWKNTEDNILHARIDLVLNTIKYADLIPRLEDIKARPHRAGFLELMIHEQYFYPQYCLYIPEFEKLVTDSAKWAVQNGYRGTLLGDIAF